MWHEERKRTKKRKENRRSAASVSISKNASLKRKKIGWKKDGGETECSQQTNRDKERKKKERERNK